MQSRVLNSFLVAILLVPGSASQVLAAVEEHEEISIREDLPLWGLIAFIGFLWAVKKLGWGPLTSGMREREETEKKLITEAEAVRQQAMAQLTHEKGNMEALDEHVREALAEAQRDADHTRQDIRAAAEREAATAMARAQVEIARVKDQSLHEIFERVSARVAEAVEQRLSERLGPAEQQRLIDEALQEFTTQNA